MKIDEKTAIRIAALREAADIADGRQIGYAGEPPFGNRHNLACQEIAAELRARADEIESTPPASTSEASGAE